MALPSQISIVLDPAWSASTIATKIINTVREAYGDSLDIDAMQAAMEEIWRSLHKSFTEEERRRIQDVAHICLPWGDFNARIVTPPSRVGYFVMFDVGLELRLVELFTAPRNVAAWTACYIRSLLNRDIKVPYWVAPAMERLMKLEGDTYPDSFSVELAREFIFSHEYGHFFLDHLRTGGRRALLFGGNDVEIFDPGLRDEIEADAFARELLCRDARKSLRVQQMGVDWLFGFLGAVLGMRARIDAAGTDSLPLAFDPAIAMRRQLAWEDYTRRCAASERNEDRLPENIENVDRLRQSVDNFNERMAPAIADLYAVAAGELVEWQKKVCEAPMSDEAVNRHLSALQDLAEGATKIRPKWSPDKWWRRMRRFVERAF